jgi:ribosome-associated protein
MLEITHTISIPESEIQIDFVQASGPGGQNVNKVASQAQLRFNVNSPALPDEVRLRLVKIAGKRITDDGTLIIQARRYRTQEQNRQDAIERLVILVRQATEKPKPRHKTRPTLASRQKRLESKRHRGEIKRLRHNISTHED